MRILVNNVILRATLNQMGGTKMVHMTVFGVMHCTTEKRKKKEGRPFMF